MVHSYFLKSRYYIFYNFIIIVYTGASMVGKTAIVSQFLYDTFIGMYKETVDDMYQGEFDLGGCHLALNIQVKIFHR